MITTETFFVSSHGSRPAFIHNIGLALYQYTIGQDVPQQE